MQQQQQQQQSQQPYKSNMRTFKPSTSSLNSLGQPKYLPPNSLDSNDIMPTATSNALSSSPNNNTDNQQQNQQLPSYQQQQQLSRRSNTNFYFTQNPEELRGEFIKTSLLKTTHGFGFTIIGANETSEDFLQIKYIVPDGAADRDGLLRQGDVLVYVNNECVLGYTHQDVVEIFQAIPVGQCVELTVCRGYPLSIDPNDPNIEIMPLAAINNPYQTNSAAPLAAVDELTASTLLNSSSNGMKQMMMIDANSNDNGNNDEYYCEEYEEMYAPIVKGPKGFGFTIADDSQMNHQKVI